jgi:hypothetical protein
MENQKMEHPSILDHKGKSYSLEELAKESKNLNPTEKKIVLSRLKGQSFSDLSQTDIRLATDKIMITGAAIYGCPLPTTEGFAEIISDQLTIFLNQFGYGKLTVSEIILSMHLNAAGVMRYSSGDYVERIEFSGQTFNVNFISKILQVYRNLRASLDRKFENQIDGY